MSYSRYRPSCAASPFIQSIWVQENPVDASRIDFAPTRVLPTGYVDIAFYFRDPFFRVTSAEQDILPAATVTGPLTRYREYGALGKTGIVLMRLRRTAAAAVFRCSLHELQDADVDLRSLIGSDIAREVEERVQSATDDRGRVSVVEQFAVERARGAPADPLAGDALRYIITHRGLVSVREVSHALRRSPRQLERTFKTFIGLSPKTFIRIVRFQRALETRKTGATWGATAYDCGYSDQAHLCNEFTRLAGLAPNALVTRTNQTPLARYFNRDAPTSDSCNTHYA